MRVCHVWENFWPIQIGGLERYILSLTTYLHKKLNIEFSLITGRSKLLLVTKNIRKFEDAGFLKVYRLGPNPVDLVNGVLFTALHSTPELAEKMRFAGLCSEAMDSKVAKSADIFHVHGIWGLSDLEYANLGLYLSQHFHKPLVVTLHGGFVGDPLIGGMQLERPAIKKILTNADIITTYSKEVHNVLEKMGLVQKTRLIVNFVDTLQLKNPSPLKHGDIILYVGRLERPQTPVLLIEAFKQAHARFPNAKFNIVGYGTLHDHLQGLIHKYNLEGAVSLLGKQTDVRRFLWSSDIFVATTFGYIASLEAWSAGLAVIGPDFGILRETIDHGSNGLLVKQHDADDLAAAMILLLENRQLRDKLALNGLETVKDYDIRTVSLKIADIYHSLIAHC
jgi:glycosyltransferase involved in cell wall biosynthesis